MSKESDSKLDKTVDHDNREALKSMCVHERVDYVRVDHVRVEHGTHWTLLQLVETAL